MQKVFVKTFKSSLSPWEAFRRMAASSKKCFFLDSAGASRGFSYAGTDPFLELTLKDNRIRLSGVERANIPAKDLFKILRRLLKKYRGLQEPSRNYFTGGAVGFLGYEMARYFENIRFRPKKSPAAPDLYLGFYSRVLAYDHQRGVYHFVFRARNKKEANLESRSLKILLSRRPPASGKFKVSRFKPEISREKFQSMVRRAKEYIGAGDIYQANLSQRFSFSFEGPEFSLYDNLRKINPSPFASFLRAGDLSIISSSPERLVSKKGDLCETRPIAGTRPRKPGLEKQLLQNPKERAEHVMLVDLERNDLGRVCDYRSVRVREMMGIEKYSHVIHIVSSITGKLSKGKDGLDLAAAMFPGGTITGCPKVRCMEIIDELEPVKRGLYTGSIGYFGFNGDMDLNIIIRTLVLHKNKGHLQVGAGIVYDSIPSKEYQETLHKAKAMMEALAFNKRVPHRGFQGRRPAMRAPGL